LPWLPYCKFKQKLYTFGWFLIHFWYIFCRLSHFRTGRWSPCHLRAIGSSLGSWTQFCGWSNKQGRIRIHDGPPIFPCFLDVLSMFREVFQTVQVFSPRSSWGGGCLRASSWRSLRETSWRLCSFRLGFLEILCMGPRWAANQAAEIVIFFEHKLGL
jgi:hypothetical protein